MKRIIGGKRYDSETAEAIAEAGWGNRGDHGYYWETLYRTKKGAWFLVGEGGCRSKYGEKVNQNTWGPGENLTPLTADEALAWLTENNEVGAIEDHFPDRVEDA